MEDYNCHCLSYSEFTKSCDEVLKARIDKELKNRLSRDLKRYFLDHCPEVVKLEEYNLDKNTNLK